MILKKTRTKRLTFVPLDLQTEPLILFSDASFTNAEGLKSQRGYLFLIVDEVWQCNVLNYGRNRCKRVARSVMAAETMALVLVFDYAFFLHTLTVELMERELTLEEIID